MNLVWVTEAEYLDGYRLLLTFNDKCKCCFDFSTLFGTNKLFDRIHDLQTFQQFVLDGWTVSWLNGEVDISPEFLYEHAEFLESPSRVAEEQATYQTLPVRE